MIKKKISQEELDKNVEITKDYELRLKLNTKKKMKIKYNNPDDIDKVFEIQSTDDEILHVRTPELKIPYKEMNFIRLTFESPNTKCIYKPSIIIRNKANKNIEEILRFKIEVNDF